MTLPEDEKLIVDSRLNPVVFLASELLGYFSFAGLFLGLVYLEAMVFGVPHLFLDIIRALFKDPLPWIVPATIIGFNCLSNFATSVTSFLTSGVVLTNRRVLFRRRLFSVLTDEVSLGDIETIFVVRPLCGRLLGYGSVYINWSGGPEIRLDYVPDPAEFRSAVALMSGVARNQSDQNALTSVEPDPQPAIHDDSRYMPKADARSERN